ncbi:tail fiber protein [Clostridium botulinum]|uniref:phage tail protein n=1 Tax=Clostridium botulinum TaxID=1491 RepID=UPI0005955B7A|nr:phage tail protein [Clostridium botulinum]AJF29678.1 tail fiber protein [Clostridium botulinum]AJF32739.1 tail fiber protein [Clostridium botulinum]
MAEQFYTILTKLGKAKIANSAALGSKVDFVKLKIGDGGGKYYNPTENQDELINQVWEGNIGSVKIDKENSNWVIVETVIPSDVGGFFIREAGIYDDEDNLIAISKLAETYKPLASEGSSKDLIIRVILEVSNAENVTLKIDPTVILATKKDVQVLESNINKKIDDINSSLKDIANDSYPIVEATGTNSYIGSSARITSLNKGTRCTLFVGSNAIGNCSLNLNNYGAKNIKDSFGNIVNNLKANIPYNLCYNGSDFILQGKGGGGNATADKLLSGSTATVDSGPITGTMPNQGSKTASLNCGGSYIIPVGYHNGNGKVTANSLASQTPGNATPDNIIQGLTAWVNGNKITGNATIENLGGTNKKSGTLTMNKETTINIQLGFKPNFVLVKSTNYSLKSTCFLHITNANFSWVYPGTYWIYGSGPSNDNFAIRYSENNELYFGIVPNDTGFNLSYNKGDNSTTVSYVACIL